MSTRFRLGISAIVVVLAAVAAAPAQAAVTVLGGGLARSCYEAVEYSRVTAARALQICDTALEQELLTKRDRAATITNRGILHMREGRFEKALADYQKSIRLMPELLESKVNLGAALYSLGRYQEALVALNEGVGTDSADAKAIGYYNRALCHERLGDIQTAYEDFRRALAARPDFELASKQLERFSVVAAPG
ncbi:MAG TPA: tetratricopeptide repeat protein [Hyphomonadaceae bacterium]|jgi:tetratricopeptide (TPR) repeat protein